MRVTLLYRVSLPECAHSASASFFFFFFFLPSLSFFAFFTLGSYKSQCAKTEQDVRREYKAKNKFMKAAAQQAQQPLKGVVKQQCRKPMRAQLATSTRQQALQGWFTQE